MPDREKVIKGLEHCEFHLSKACLDCPYSKYNARCLEVIKADAIALLREQDTVEYALEVLKAHGWKDGAEGVEPNKPGTAY